MSYIRIVSIYFSGKEKRVGIQFRDRGSVAGLGGFFYCSKNRKNPLLPRQQWKVGVVGCGQLTTTIKKNPFWASIYPPPQSHTILCKEVDRSACNA